MQASEVYNQICVELVADAGVRLGRVLTAQERDAVFNAAEGSLLFLEEVARDLTAATTPEHIEAELYELVTLAERREAPPPR